LRRGGRARHGGCRRIGRFGLAVLHFPDGQPTAFHFKYLRLPAFLKLVGKLPLSLRIEG
jgi:hypothetical protein